MSIMGKTSTEHGHSHRFRIDEDGNGRTSFDVDHSHRIKSNKVAEAKDHSHTLKLRRNRYSPSEVDE